MPFKKKMMFFAPIGLLGLIAFYFVPESRQNFIPIATVCLYWLVYFIFWCIGEKKKGKQNEKEIKE